MRFADSFNQRILGEEARGTGKTDQRKRADQTGPVGNRHVLPEIAHLAHVLLVMHTDDHRASGKEQQRLEEGMSHQMEHRTGIG